MTWSGFSYNSGMTGQYGRSRMVDCEPSTTLLTDGLCEDGDNIILDVGDATTSRPMSAYFEVVGDYLEVSLYSSDTPRPTLSMAPTTAAPTQSPSKEDDQCGKEKYCCDFLEISNYETFYKIRDVRRERAVLGRRRRRLRDRRADGGARGRGPYGAGPRADGRAVGRPARLALAPEPPHDLPGRQGARGQLLLPAEQRRHLRHERGGVRRL